MKLLRSSRRLLVSARRGLPKVHPSTGMVLKKSKGQHILHNEGVLDVIVEASGLRRFADTVLEIGPGTGVLTMKLLAHARRVIAIDIEESMLHEVKCRAEALGLVRHRKDLAFTTEERKSDEDLVEKFFVDHAPPSQQRQGAEGLGSGQRLEEVGSAEESRLEDVQQNVQQFSSSAPEVNPGGRRARNAKPAVEVFREELGDNCNLRLYHGDVLDQQVFLGSRAQLTLPRFDVCVANLPYRISSAFLFFLLNALCHEHTRWKRAVLMFQAEFAERLVADPGEHKFNRLSMNARLFCKAEKIMDVKGGSFIPQPQVRSTIVRLTPRTDVCQKSLSSSMKSISKAETWRPQQGSSSLISPLAAAEVTFLEWNTLMKLLFQRRKRTLIATFRLRKVQSMLESNYRKFCSVTRTVPRVFGLNVRDVCVDLMGERLARRCVAELDAPVLVEMLRKFHSHGIYIHPASVDELSAKQRLSGDFFPVSGDNGAPFGTGGGYHSPYFHVPDDEVETSGKINMMSSSGAANEKGYYSLNADTGGSEMISRAEADDDSFQEEDWNKIFAFRSTGSEHREDHVDNSNNVKDHGDSEDSRSSLDEQNVDMNDEVDDYCTGSPVKKPNSPTATFISPIGRTNEIKVMSCTMAATTRTSCNSAISPRASVPIPTTLKSKSRLQAHVEDVVKDSIRFEYDDQEQDEDPFGSNWRYSRPFLSCKRSKMDHERE
ncbi:unnamed protein product [Amoebophrya sp. A25]|nr:unnamed protein product [Amoebophrya sp. A25]|eukprot:GSA25T00005439001.1